jgi:hypothetical protein
MKDKYIGTIKVGMERMTDRGYANFLQVPWDEDNETPGYFLTTKWGTEFWVTEEEFNEAFIKELR